MIPGLCVNRILVYHTDEDDWEEIWQFASGLRVRWRPNGPYIYSRDKGVPGHGRTAIPISEVEHIMREEAR